MKKNKGLRRRWLVDNVIVVFLLGVLIALLLSAILIGFGLINKEQETRVVLSCVIVVLIVVVVVLISNSFHVRSVVVPLREIIDKSKKITKGSYGIQIEKKYEGEIGQLADTINEMSM